MKPVRPFGKRGELEAQPRRFVPFADPHPVGDRHEPAATGCPMQRDGRVLFGSEPSTDGFASEAGEERS